MDAFERLDGVVRAQVSRIGRSSVSTVAGTRLLRLDGDLSCRARNRDYVRW